MNIYLIILAGVLTLAVSVAILGLHISCRQIYEQLEEQHKQTESIRQAINDFQEHLQDIDK